MSSFFLGEDKILSAAGQIFLPRTDKKTKSKRDRWRKALPPAPKAPTCFTSMSADQVTGHPLPASTAQRSGGAV